jgi:cobalamin biosynthesis protein CobT
MKCKRNPTTFGLVGPFTKIARSLSRNHDVEIIPSGTKCKTNGHKIWIPFNSDKLTDGLQQRLNGILDHETAHVSEEREAAAAGQTTALQIVGSLKRTEPTVKMLFAAFEDVRIETKWSDLYPGASENLKALNIDLVERLKRGGCHGNVWKQIGCGIICLSRGLDCSWLDPNLVPYLERCKMIVGDCYKMVWPKDALALARRVHSELRDLAEEQKKKPEQTHGDDSDGDDAAGDDAAGDGGSDGDDSGDGIDGGEVDSGDDVDNNAEDDDVGTDVDGVIPDSDDDDAAGDDDDNSDDGNGSIGIDDADSDGTEDEADGAIGDGADGDNDDDPPSDSDHGVDDRILNTESDQEDLMDESRKELSDDVAKEASEHNHYIPHPALVDMDGFVDERRVLHSSSEQIARQARAEVSTQVSALRSKQLAYLQAITRTQRLVAQRSGRLDRRALSKARLGSDSVYTDLTTKLDLDTAIEVLVDMSGSMGRNTRRTCAAYWATRCSIALAEAWQGLHIPNEFIGFWNTHNYPPHDSQYICRGALCYFMIKDWGETFTQALPRFGAINGFGGNTDGEAVLFSAHRLAIRPEKRKILVVVSDGYPAAVGAASIQLNKHLKEVILLITRSGIEVLGVGAGTNAPKRFYNDTTGAENIVINNLSTLSIDVFKAMKQMLIGHQKRVRHGTRI